MLMRTDTIIELTVDKGMRICCAGKYAATINPLGTGACIVHPKARILQEDSKVYSSFGDDEKLAVVGPQGIVFTMKGHRGKLCSFIPPILRIIDKLETGSGNLQVGRGRGVGPSLDLGLGWEFSNRSRFESMGYAAVKIGAKNFG